MVYGGGVVRGAEFGVLFVFAVFPAIVALMEDASVGQRVALVVTYMLLGFPLMLKWTVAFPKLWVILALF